MDSTLPDAVETSQPGSQSDHANEVGNTGLEGATNNVDAKAPFVKLDDPPKFDLESYIANYTGRTRFKRLFLIGTCSTYLATDALRLAVTEAKSDRDVSRYESAVRALAEVAPNDKEGSLDTEWVERMRRVTKAETDRLEQELRGYKNNLIKESIRMGNEDLGQHYHQIGDLVSASKAYSRMRDYCTTTNHIASMLLKIINLSIERGDWLSVQSNVHRLRNLHPSKPEEQLKNQPKASTALGLSQMHSGSYYDAANSFLATDPSLGDSYKEIITSNDVAVYGGLCALASMDRLELQRRVLDNNSFRNFLELEPHIRRAISFFCNSKFKPCLEILESYRTDYLLDVYLQRHVAIIYSRIRVKAIQQYLVPFSRVTLDAMSKIFAAPPKDGQTDTTDPNSSFVKELNGLIEDGALDAHIDTERRVLVSKQTDPRTRVQEATQESILNYTREAHLRLLRTSNVQYGPESRGEFREQLRGEPGYKAVEFPAVKELINASGLGASRGRFLRTSDML